MRETCQNMTALQDWFNITELPVRRFNASLSPRLGSMLIFVVFFDLPSACASAPMI